MNGPRGGVQPQAEPAKARNGALRTQVAVMDVPERTDGAQVSSPPAPRVTSRFGALGALAKRVIQRLLRFYTIRQDIMNAELAARISALETTRVEVAAVRRDLVDAALDFAAIADRMRAFEKVRRIVERSSAFRDEVRSHRRELADLRTQTGAMSARLTLLQRQMAPAQGIRFDVEALQGDVVRLEDLVRDAQESSANALERVAERLDEHAERASRADARVAAFRHDIDEVRSSAARDLAQRSVELRAVVEEVERRLADTADGLAGLVENGNRANAVAVDLLRGDVGGAIAAIRDDLEGRIERAQRIAATLRTAFDAFIREAAEDRVRAGAAGERLAAAEERLEQLSAALAELRDVVPAQNDALRGDIAQLGQRVDAVSEGARELEAGGDQAPVLARRVSDVAGALNEVRTLAAEVRAALDAGAPVRQGGEQTASLDSMQRRLDAVAAEIGSLRARLVVTPYMSAPIEAWPAQRLSTPDDFDYVGFEDVFRGPEDFIRERLRPYVPLVADHAPVVELGSGRGEFLELMREHDIAATGVDLNADAVARCRAKGLENVVLADANAHLAQLEERSVGAVFSAQFAEHLSFTELLRCLELARMRLVPGGLFIAETVNPNSIEAWKTFFVDLSHQRPLFPEVFVFLCRSMGFTGVRIFYPNGGGFDEAAPTAQHQYAVVATAPQAERTAKG